MIGNTNKNSVSEMIDGMCYTLQKNKNEIENVVSNSPTHNIEITFKVNPNEIITMELTTVKPVIKEDDKIVVFIKEVENENNK